MRAHLKILSFFLLSIPNILFAGDDIVIQINKFDESNRNVERNYLQIDEGNIWYFDKNEKGNLRPLLPGELATILKAMKSQLSSTILTSKSKPKDIAYYRFHLEYDVGAINIRYNLSDVKLTNILLSDEMKSVVTKYFGISYQ